MDSSEIEMDGSEKEIDCFSNVMETLDTALIIFSYRRLIDNINNSYITKYLFELSKDVIKYQINIKRLFIRFKTRTVFPPKKYKRNIGRPYYTLKNRYQNKEDTPILTS
jgi:hypothetical protein